MLTFFTGIKVFSCSRPRFGPSRDWIDHVIWFYLHTGPVVVTVYNWSHVNWELFLIPYIFVDFTFGVLPNTRTERTAVLRLCLGVRSVDDVFRAFLL